MAEVDLKDLVQGGLRLAERASDEAYFAAACIRAGMVRLEPPHRIAQMVGAFQRHGMLAALVTVGAMRNGDRVAIRDERGDVTYRELEERTNALANAWRGLGLGAGDGVTILVRNHRGFLESMFAAAKCGARIVLLNTSFAGPQIRAVADREGTDLLVHDDEYAELLEGVKPRYGRWRAWTDGDGSASDGRDPAPTGEADGTLASLIAGGATGAPPKPASAPRIVILTSGTTGTPKGAPRSEPKSLGLIGGLLGKVPMRARETTEIAVPLFHALGLASMALGLALGSTLVLRRRFDPRQTLEGLRDNDASALVVVPVMLARILELGEDEIRAHRPPSLRVIFVSGSALGVDLTRRAMAAFGPVVYDMYGSTEVAYATIATPADMLAEPGSVGTVVRGAVVRILDDRGEEAPAGVTGRIFVGNSAQFEGYTGGETKEQIGGLMASGDVGHFSAHGRLFIDGRDDEMIVSGGENVFPAEVEDLLATHEAVLEVAVIGVEDTQFGQRLKAFVVRREGATLSEAEVTAYVRDNLARFKVPREVVFLDELPRNATGKVLKRLLGTEA